jgi:hypothetical protein
MAGNVPHLHEKFCNLQYISRTFFFLYPWFSSAAAEESRTRSLFLCVFASEAQSYLLIFFSKHSKEGNLLVHLFFRTSKNQY